LCVIFLKRKFGTKTGVRNAKTVFLKYLFVLDSLPNIKKKEKEKYIVVRTSLFFLSILAFILILIFPYPFEPLGSLSSKN
jgi:hypothetical protein